MATLSKNLYDLTGLSLEDFSNLTSGIGNLGELFLGLEGLDFANEQFDFKKDLALTNLANQARTLNAELLQRQLSRNARGVGIDANTYMQQFGALQSLANGQTPNVDYAALIASVNGNPAPTTGNPNNVSLAPTQSTAPTTGNNPVTNSGGNNVQLTPQQIQSLAMLQNVAR